jgi:hypothetical protein
MSDEVPKQTTEGILLQRKDKFLCVYFESLVAESYQEIIMKINNTI